MSKVRINDLARELEVKSKQILDALEFMGLAEGKTHSSSIEAHEAEKVRGHFERGSKPAPSASSRSEQENRPKIDLSNISKPGDVMKAILARKQEAERQAQYPQRPGGAPPVVVRPTASGAASGSASGSAAASASSGQTPAGVKIAAPVSGGLRPAAPPPPRVVTAPPVAARPEPRKIVPQPRQAPPIIHPPQAPSTPAIGTRPPSGPVVARPHSGAISGTSTVRPAVSVAPPPVAVVVKPPTSTSASTAVAPPVVVVAPPPAKTVAPEPEIVATPTVAIEEPVRIAKPVHTAVQPSVQAATVAAPEPVVTEPSPSAPQAVVASPASSNGAAPADVQIGAPVSAPVAEEPVAAAPEATAVVAPPTPVVQVRKVVMPQTGPRPVYKAPPPPPPSAAPAANANAAGIQRGKPIFDRRPQSGPSSGPGGYTPRPQSGPGGFQNQGAPGQFPGGPRPKHPTRPGFAGSGPSGPGGPGARPGFGARPGGFAGGPRPGGFGAGPGGPPPAGEAPRAPRPSGPPRGRGRQQYPKTKEGPMKGFVPPPRFGGAYMGNEPPPITREITVTEGISVKDLAEKLEVRAKDLIATLLMRGVFVTVNQSLDAEMVKDVAARFGAGATVISYEDEIANQAIEEILESDNIDELEVPRSPVVTVMGHVDHGKTSLLDAIRETDVASGEAGGITQHIGAYKVKFTKEGSPASGREIVFLDTPGHEAFTRMRARGAKVTDLVVIVVAADDGPMPQTIEAIDHAKAAGVPMIVAINKIDRPEANPEKVMKQLADRGLVPEEWGGDVVYVPVSAKKRIGLDQLLEMICLVSDVQSLKSTPGRKAVGTVLEAKLDRGRGAVATVLVQNGTLHVNESFIVGNTFGKVRAMFDDRGRAITEAGPSTPVEVLGLEGMPDSGDTFLVVADRDKAKGIAQYRKMKEREAQLAKSSRVSLEGLAEQIRLAGVKDLPLIIKGDVTGSVEVIADSLVRMSTEKVRIKVIHSGVGAITESDILLASASNAIIIGFNVRPERKSAELAQQENVEIRLHSIIYELQDEIRKAMLGLLDPTFRESYLGRAEVINVIRIPKVGTVAGCRVTDGVLRRDAEIKLMRGTEQIFKGKIGSLRRFKDDVKEVTNGMECGVGLAGFSDIKEGDVIDAFTTERMASDLGQLATTVAAAAKEAKEAKEQAAAETANRS